MSSISIHILDDDSLLNVFHLFRLTYLDKDETNNQQIFEEEWVRERWWYKFTHVCQRWRSIIFGSASYLDLCLVCTYRTPVADMLAHSPPLPLVIDHLEEYYKKPTNFEDEAGMLLALQQRDRVRRIRLRVHISDMRSLCMAETCRFIEAINDRFPMLEYLCIMPRTEPKIKWILPTRFRAPRLRYLVLAGFTLPIRSLLLTTGAGLTTLTLKSVDPSADFSPNGLLERLSLMHHLQSFAIHFDAPRFDDDVREQSLVMTHVTLPNLRSFGFEGKSAYLEALLPHITTPLLEKLYISLVAQRTLSIPHILQFIVTTGNLTCGLRSAVFRVGLGGWVALYPDVGARMYSLCFRIQSFYPNKEVELAAQVLDVLRPVLSEVVHLTLECTKPFGWYNRTDPSDWRNLFGTFGNVKTLSMPNTLVGEVSRSLRSDNGEPSVDLLPELNKLECYGWSNASNLFIPFIGARRNAGCPVTLVRYERFPFTDNTILPMMPTPFL